MRHLMIVAHGSRHAASNQEVACLAARVATCVAGRFDHTSVAFLELAAPRLEAALLEVLAAGASEVVVVPYFLASGSHLQRDIPAIIRRVEAQCPRAQIELTVHVGAAEAMVDLITTLLP